MTKDDLAKLNALVKEHDEWTAKRANIDLVEKFAWIVFGRSEDPTLEFPLTVDDAVTIIDKHILDLVNRLQAMGYYV